MQIERNQVAGIYFSKHLLEIQDMLLLRNFFVFSEEPTIFFCEPQVYWTLRLFSFALKKLLQLFQKVLNLFTIGLKGSRQVVVEGNPIKWRKLSW